MKKFFAFFSGMSILLIVLGIAGFFWWKSQLEGALADAEQEQITFVVEEGSGLKTVAADLEEEGLVKSAFVYEAYNRINGQPLIQAGTYQLNRSLDVPEIASIFSEGSVATQTFTITPGRRLAELVGDLERQGLDDAEEALSLEYGSRIEAAATWDSLEGVLAAETYTVSLEEGSAEVVRQAIERTDSLLLELEQDFATHDLSIEEALILASIIELEVVELEDMRRVAGVFLNRLEIGMMLGSDVTFVFAAKELGVPPTVDLDSPFNTRIHAGLTPSPVATVGEQVLRALADPIITDDIFFVSGDDGVTHFSETLAEHEQNIADFCTTLCQ